MPDSYRNPRFSVIVDAKNGEQLQILFFPCAIVCSNKGQQLHKSAFLCNCCLKKQATIAHSTFLSEATCTFFAKTARKLHKSAFLCNFCPWIEKKCTRLPALTSTLLFFRKIKPKITRIASFLLFSPPKTRKSNKTKRRAPRWHPPCFALHILISPLKPLLPP